MNNEKVVPIQEQHRQYGYQPSDQRGYQPQEGYKPSGTNNEPPKPPTTGSNAIKED